MVSIRKRIVQDVGIATIESSQPISMLQRLRNTWQFACIYQWLYIFGSVVKLDNIDIEDLEGQCLSPHSTLLQDIGLQLLKYLSSHRGLTNESFDEFTRRQFASKAPHIPNPFGTDEAPIRFSDFNVFKKIRVLHHMTVFIMMNAEKLREKMAEQKDVDHDQTSWRIEPFGWDSHDFSYYVLDDNRVYRLTELPPPPARSKKNTKQARAEARRQRKRRRISAATKSGTDDDVEEFENVPFADSPKLTMPEGDEDIDVDLGGMQWECVAATLEELRQFLAKIPGKKDANERVLREKIVQHLLPILEQQEERRKKREKEREKELLNLERMATAKRSSRIANRQEVRKQEEQMREEEQRVRREQEANRKEQQLRRKLENERNERLLSRETRLREREARRVQNKKDLAELSSNRRDVHFPTVRLSERRRMNQVEMSNGELEKLEQGIWEEEWSFDCVCGLHGKVDDGQHSISCEKCGIWQHSKCLGIDEQVAEKEDFHFECDRCCSGAQRSESEHQTHHPPDMDASFTPAVKIPGVPSQTPAGLPVTDICVDTITDAKLPSLPATAGQGGSQDLWLMGNVSKDGFPASRFKNLTSCDSRPGHIVVGTPAKEGVDMPYLPGPTSSGKPATEVHLKATAAINNNPFSSPHPGLSPPGLSPRKYYAYETIYEQETSARQNLLPRKSSDHEPTLQISPHLQPNSNSLCLDARPHSFSFESEGNQDDHSASSPTASKTVNAVHEQHHETPLLTPGPKLPLPREDSPGALLPMQAHSHIQLPRVDTSPIKQASMVAGECVGETASFNRSSFTLPPYASFLPTSPTQNLTPPVKLTSSASPHAVYNGPSGIPSSSGSKH